MSKSEVERNVLDAWAAEMPGVKVETHLDLIRKRIKHVAFHESGHAAANAFLGLMGPSHFEEISIIPNPGCLGRILHSRVTPLAVSGGWASKHGQVKGKMTIIFLLAGRVAESRVNDDISLLKDDLYFGWEESLCDSEVEWRRLTDEGKALDIAEALSNKIWPPFRVLSMMEKWTNELLNIPAVWAVVEALAEKLIREGKIVDYDVFCTIVEPILYKWIESPVWKKRFTVDDFELE